MYKIYTKIPDIPRKLSHKVVLIMRLTTVFLIASLMQVSAATYGQGITLHQKNQPLSSVLKEIRKQSGYDFYYDFNDISKSKKVNIDVINASLDETLNNLFKGSNFGYSLEGKIVSIKKTQNYYVSKQALEIKGTVEDAETGNALVGATVMVKNSGNKTVTGKNGEFGLVGVSYSDTLRVSFIGYISREIPVSQKNLKIKLTAAIGTLNAVDVVSTGYQYIKPTQVTGAVSSIGTKEYESRINTDFLTGLVNRLPGLVINNDVTFSSNTYPDNNKNGLFNIRGISTITGNQNPLIVLDGYPTELKLSDIKRIISP